MAIQDRRARERAARHELILATARTLAEAGGWDAVTTRRLSAEIEYSQPILYKHFSGMQEIVQTVALEGFGELADALRAARSDAGTPQQALHRVAHAYIDFARANPALYDAMFIRDTGLPFANDATPPQLVAAFAELRHATALAMRGGGADTLTEVFWSALHGLVTLAHSGRLRPEEHDQRIDLLVCQFASAPAAQSASPIPPT